MRPRGALLGAALVAWLGGACAARRPPEYLLHRAAGDRAYTAGRMSDAAREYDLAARALSARDRDRHEALYLAAAALERAGDLPGALARYDRVAAQDARWDRGPRAALEAAMLRRDSGDRARALSDLEALARRELITWPGRRALSLALDLLVEDDPTLSRALALLDALEVRYRHTDVLDVVLWERATRLERAGRAADAAATYERLLTAVPYPFNRHWDDGGVALARLLVASGDARRAVAVLDRMLAVREPSTLNGSYEAPRFGEGALLRARVLRDALGAREAAAEAFHQVYASFVTSRFRDDALWEELSLRDALGQGGAACGLARRLAVEFPCTRFGRRGRARALACGLEVPPERPRSEGGCGRDGGEGGRGDQRPEALTEAPTETVTSGP